MKHRLRYSTDGFNIKIFSCRAGGDVLVLYVRAAFLRASRCELCSVIVLSFGIDFTLVLTGELIWQFSRRQSTYHAAGMALAFSSARLLQGCCTLAGEAR